MALQVVSAMAPFAQAGLVNMAKLAEYVLGTGFGIKNASAFLTQPQAPEAPQGPEPMSPDQQVLEGQGLPPGMTPDQMQPQLPPGLIPGAPIQGPGGEVGAPPMGALESLPPEILQLLLAQAQQAPPM
jgi:hypothetical protein